MVVFPTSPDEQIVTTALTAEEVEGLFEGRRAVVQSVSAFAALTLATEFVDSVARKREEELSMEVRNVPEMVKIAPISVMP